MVEVSEIGGLRVAIVDDEPIARSRLRRLLNSVGESRIQVALECGSAEEFLSSGPDAALDAAFVDIEMPGGDGLDAIENWPGVKPHMVVVSAHPQHALRAFNARAIDYLTKPVSEARLREALDRAYTYRPTLISGHGADRPPVRIIDLTPRQREILQLLADRRSNKEIARLLAVSPFTVRNHLSVLYRLFGVQSRRSLLASALQLGAVEPSNGGLWARVS